MNRLWIKRILTVALVIGTTTSALYLHAEEKVPADNDKMRAEYKALRKADYLKSIDEREKYFTTMAEEMRKQKTACSGDDYDACKKAREATKAIKDKNKEATKARREKFKADTAKYREALGDDKPKKEEGSEPKKKKLMDFFHKDEEGEKE